MQQYICYLRICHQPNMTWAILFATHESKTRPIILEHSDFVRMRCGIESFPALALFFLSPFELCFNRSHTIHNSHRMRFVQCEILNFDTPNYVKWIRIPHSCFYIFGRKQTLKLLFKIGASRRTHHFCHIERKSFQMHSIFKRNPIEWFLLIHFVAFENSIFQCFCSITIWHRLFSKYKSYGNTFSCEIDAI